MLYNIIRSYDVFSKTIHFTLNDKKFVSTFIGGLVSFIIFLITIVILILCIIDKDKNINIIVNRFTVNDSKLHIDHNTFPFAFYISDNNFNIKISFYLNNQFYNEIGYQHCSSNNIVNDTNWFCPSNFSIDINSDDSYITIELSNTTEIKEDVSFSFMYMNSYYDNYYNDNNRYDFFYEFINDTYTITNKEISLLYSIYQKNIEEDNNLILHSVKKSTSLSIFDISQSDNESKESKIKITFKASNQKMIMYVNHNFNLFYVLSVLGGIANCLYLISSGVLYAYERTHTNLEMLNSVFDFSSYNSSKKFKENAANNSFLFQSNIIKNEKKENESKDKIKLTENKSDLKTSDICPSINVMDFTNINMRDNFKAKNQMINCTDNFDLRLKKLIVLKQIKSNSLNRLLKFSFCESLHVYFCCALTKTFSSKKKLYSIKLREVNTLLSLSRYFEQANTIDKICNVLLGKGQRGVLSLLSRELIYKALERNKVDLLNDEVSFENQVMKYANKIKDINYNRTCIDKRIIKIIDKINLI